MFTRKRARQVAEKECVSTPNIALKKSKMEKSARTNTDAAGMSKSCWFFLSTTHIDSVTDVSFRYFDDDFII